MKWQCKICGMRIEDVRTSRIYCRCGTVDTVPLEPAARKKRRSNQAPNWMVEHRVSTCKNCERYHEGQKNRCDLIDLGCSGTYHATLHKIDGKCPENKWTKKRHRYVTTADLVAATIAIADQIPPEVIRVIGIPRSGMLPASILATKLHLPLYTINNFEIIYAGGGSRMGWGEPETNGGPWLFVDDTIHNGITLDRLRLGGVPVDDHFTCCIYSLELNRCDFCAEQLETPHILEWNLFNTAWIVHQGCDMDGIICHNPPNQDKPQHLIRNNPVKVIISARPERDRAATVEWLARYGVRYEALELWPGSETDGWNPTLVAKWKADVAHQYGVEFYIESEPELADLIRAHDLRVLCPAQGYLE